MHPLDDALKLQQLEHGRFAAELDGRFWGHTAAHGGYLAALLLRAMRRVVNDPSRAPRSLTTHFLAGPRRGPAEVHVETLRVGGRVSSLSARIVQDGAPTTSAIAAFGAPFRAPAFQHASMPVVPSPEACERRRPTRVEIDQRFEHRQCFGGPPFGGASLAVIGGYSRLEGGSRALDAEALTLLCDGWVPALFTTLSDGRAAGACPTLDFTVHFRTGVPSDHAAPGDYVLVELHTQALVDGYLDEAARVWARDGTLLAQSVQHAVRLEPRIPAAH